MREMTNLDDFVTVGEAAKLAGVTVKEIHDMITFGEIEDTFIRNTPNPNGRRQRMYSQHVRKSSVIRCFGPDTGATA